MSCVVMVGSSTNHTYTCIAHLHYAYAYMHTCAHEGVRGRRERRRGRARRGPSPPSPILGAVFLRSPPDRERDHRNAARKSTHTQSSAIHPVSRHTHICTHTDIYRSERVYACFADTRAGDVRTCMHLCNAHATHTRLNTYICTFCVCCAVTMCVRIPLC